MLHPRTDRVLKAANKNSPALRKRLIAIGGWIGVGVLIIGGIYYLFTF